MKEGPRVGSGRVHPAASFGPDLNGRRGGEEAPETREGVAEMAATEKASRFLIA